MTLRPLRLARRRLLVELLWFALALLILSYSWMFATISVPNERSRLYLSVAMVDHHTLSIDRPIQRFGRIFDWAKYKGRAYTDKAPGSSLIAAIPYAIVRAFSQPEDWPIERLINLARTWLMLPLGLVGFFVMRRTVYALGLDDEIGLITAFGWLLGTTAFHYSTALYGHQIVGVALLAALCLVLRAEALSAEAATTRALALRLFGAGLCAGIAGLTEYQAGVPCVLLTLYVLAGPLRKRPLLVVAFGLGALPCVLALMAYNNAAFGSPFDLSYHHLVNRDLATLHREGVGGVTLPNTRLLIPVTFSLHRGLFTTSPALLLAIPGAAWLWRSGHRRLGALVATTLLFNIAFVAGTRAWFGGWSFGARLMVPGMSWMMLGVAWALHRYWHRLSWQVIARGLLVAGVLIQQLIHIVFPELPETATNPLPDIVWPSLRAAHISPNLLSSLTTIQGLPSLIPLAAALLIVCTYLATPTLATPTPPQDTTPPADPDGGADDDEVVKVSDAPDVSENPELSKAPRTTTPTPLPPARRALLALASAWALILWLTVSHLAGPSWDQHHRDRFQRWMHSWAEKEVVLRVKARAWPHPRPLSR